MAQLVVGHDAQVAEWVRRQIPSAPNFGQCTAIGVARDDRLIAGVVFNNYHGHMIEASMAASEPRWCSRGVLCAFFAYPFEQLEVRRIQLTVSKRNKKARCFAEKLGFTLEGVGREAMRNGDDACVYGMLWKDCRWLKETHNGKI